MTKKNSIVKSTVLCVFVLLVALSMSMALHVKNRPAAAEIEQSVTAADILSYDEAEFTVSEDYSAFVSPSIIYGNGWNVGRLDPNDEMTMQLDPQKSGLLVSSVDTGKNAEGKSFAFKQKLNGDFNLDFRVFSQQSFYGKRDFSAKSGEIDGIMQNNGTVVDDRWNPFLDLRGVGIKIISATDATKAFTVYVYGGQQWGALETSARVHIEGEQYTDAGRKGYGLSGGKDAPGGYAYFTELAGTSFCNVSGRQKESYFNSIKFDIDTMTVYGTAKTLTGSSRGAYYTETDLLIRNIGTNNLAADNSGAVVSGVGLKTLASKDFSGGYYAEIVIDDMTGDETPLAYPVNKEGGDAVYGNAEGKVVSGFENGYARTANMILYNINGQDLKKHTDFTVEAIDEYTFPTQSSVPTSGAVTSGVRLISPETGVAAEGNSFALNGDDYINNGIFSAVIGAKAQQYAPKVGRESDISDYFNKNEVGLGKNYVEWDPYSDVREIGVTFRSVADASKAFTAYFTTRDTERMALSARVGIEGERYRDGSGKKGLSGTNNAWGTGLTAAKGTFGMFNNTGNDTYNTTDNPYVMLKFNPLTMDVMTYGYGWNTIRTLSTTVAAGSGALTDYTKTLQAADFADGYDVSIEIIDMTPNHNRGLKNIYALDGNGNSVAVSTEYTAADGNYILPAAYERKAIIEVLGYRDKDDATQNQAIDSDSVTTSSGNISGYIKPDAWLDLGCSAVIGHRDSISMDVAVTDVFSSVAPNEAVTYSHETEDDTGALSFDAGKGIFGPKHLGRYTFTCGKLTRDIVIIDDEPPHIAPKDGLVSTVRKGSSFSVQKTDIVATDKFSETTVTVSCRFNGRDIRLDDVSTARVGVYEITYTAKDAYGNTAAFNRHVAVVHADRTAPKIGWNGVVTQAVVSEVVDLSGITAVDDREGGVSVAITKAVLIKQNGTEKNITVTDSRVTATETGEIYIYVEATDDSGNVGEAVYRIEVLTKLREVVDAANYVSTEQEVPGSPKLWWVFVVAAAGVLLIGVGILLFVLKKRKTN